MEIDKVVKVRYDLTKVSKDELGALLNMLTHWRDYVSKLPRGTSDVDPLQVRLYNDLYYALYGQHPVWGPNLVS